MEREPIIGREHDAGIDSDRDTWPLGSAILPMTDEEIEAEAAEAEADIAAGRVYPHSLVSAWLETWGSPDYKPFDEWLKSSG
ncbi:hypothetical protein [uncultured Sphingomonas sp.]|uniref:hypothetical protein n=1 Tax=uncultured Sphingomonas sp. TaxID=158754 RepID=UPI0035CA839D